MTTESADLLRHTAAALYGDMRFIKPELLQGYQAAAARVLSMASSMERHAQRPGSLRQKVVDAHAAMNDTKRKLMVARPGTTDKADALVAHERALDDFEEALNAWAASRQEAAA